MIVRLIHKGDRIELLTLTNNIVFLVFNIIQLKTKSTEELSCILKDTKSGKFFLKIFTRTDVGIDLGDYRMDATADNKSYLAIYPHKR